MQYVSAYAVDTSGKTIPGASVSIYGKTSGTLAPLFDANGDPISNPVIAGNSGLYGYAAADGDYTVEIAGQPSFTAYLLDPADVASQIAAAQAAAEAAAQSTETATTALNIGDYTAQSLADTLTTVLADIASLQSYTTAAQVAADNALAAVRTADSNIALAQASLLTDEGNLTAEIAARIAAENAIDSSITSLTETVNSNQSSLSAEITTLQSQYNGLNSTVTNNYATLSTASSTQAADIATLQSQYGSLSSTLTSDYATLTTLTSTQAEDITTLQSNYNTLSALVSSSSTTSATSNATLAAEITTLQASYGYGANLVSNSTFALGSQGWNAHYGSAGNDGGSGYFYWVWSLAAGDLGFQDVNFIDQTIPMYAGVAYSIQALLYGVGLGPNTFVRGVFHYLTSTGASNGYQVAVQTEQNTGWSLVKADTANNGGNGFGPFYPPAGTTQCNLYFDVCGGSGDAQGSGGLVAVAEVKVERGLYCTPWSDNVTTAIQANITSEAVTRAAADSSLASEITTLTTNYNSLSSEVTTNYNAFTTAQAATATSLSTLTAQAAVNSNLLPYGNFEGTPYGQAIPVGWTRGVNGTDLGGEVVYQDPNYGALAYMGAFTSTGPGSYLLYDSLPFPLDAAEFTFSANMECISGGVFGGSGSYCFIQMLYYTGTNGTGTLNYGPESAAYTGGLEASGASPLKVTATAPAGTQSCVARLVIEGPTSGVTYSGYFNRAKIEQGPTATAYTPEGALGVLGASVTQSAAAIVTLDGKTAAYLIQSVNAGTGNASVELASNGVTGIIELVCDILSIANGSGNPIQALLVSGGEVYVANDLYIGSSIKISPSNGGFIEDNGTIKMVLAEPFGATGNLLFWVGPTGTALSACTTANAYVYITTAGVFGGSGVPNAGGGTLSNTGSSVSFSNAGWTTAATCSFGAIPAGGYWTNLQGFITDPVIGSNSLSSGSVATINWRIVESGTTASNVVLDSGSFTTNYNSGEGMYFPASSGNTGYQFESKNVAIACRNSGAVSLQLQFQMASSVTLSNIVGTVGATATRGG